MLITIILLTLFFLCGPSCLRWLDFKYFYSPLFVLRQILFSVFAHAKSILAKILYTGTCLCATVLQADLHAFKLAQQSICFPCNAHGNIATLFFHFFCLVNVVINHLCALCNCLKYLCLFGSGCN